MNPRSNKMLTAVGVLQSLLALLALTVSAVASEIFWTTDIDAEKPTHHVPLAARVGDAAVVFGPIVLWLTLAAILICKRRELGWWLCVLADFCVAGFGLLLLADDLSHFVEIRSHPALHGDVFYHLVLVLLPSVGLILLFSASIRTMSSAFRKENGVGNPGGARAPS